jgi:hypothetical protein
MRATAVHVLGLLLVGTGWAAEMETTKTTAPPASGTLPRVPMQVDHGGDVPPLAPTSPASGTLPRVPVQVDHGGAPTPPLTPDTDRLVHLTCRDGVEPMSGFHSPQCDADGKVDGVCTFASEPRALIPAGQMREIVSGRITYVLFCQPNR